MIQSITVDLIPNGKMPMLHASQYDDGRQVRINLTENRQAYTLTGNEVLSLAVRKADNTLVTMDIANTYGGKSYVEFSTTEQMCACAGLNFGELTITNNGTKVGSLNFYIAVEPSPEAGGLRSASEINNLNRQIDDHIDEVLPEMVEDIAPAIVEEVAPAVVREVAPSVVEDVAPAILDRLAPSAVAEVAPAVVAELVPPAVAEVAPSVVREVAEPIVEELVPIAVGNNYYTKSETDDKITALIDDTQASESKAYSSDKVVALLGNKADATEVENIRVGADGTTYASAGDAVRGQVANLSNNIKSLPSTMFNGLAVTNFEQGSIGADGSTISRANRIRTGFIDVTIFKSQIMASINSDLYKFGFAFYSTNDASGFIETSDAPNNVSTLNNTFISLPSNAKYIRLVVSLKTEGYIYPADMQSFNVFICSDVTSSIINKKIDNLIYPNKNITYKKGVYSATGSLSDSSNGASTNILSHLTTAYIMLDCSVVILLYKGEKYVGKINASGVVDQVAGSWKYFKGLVDIAKITNENNCDGVAFSIIPPSGTTIANDSQAETYGQSHVIYSMASAYMAFVSSKTDISNDYVIGSDWQKRPIVLERTIGNLKYQQSFCIYNGFYFSVQEGVIAKQDSNFNVVAENSINIGHPNVFQLGKGAYAWASGMSDNTVYKVDLETLSVVDSILLPTTGVTNAVVDEDTGLMYLLNRTDNGLSVDNHNFIVYDYINDEIISTKKTDKFSAMQAMDIYNDTILIVNGLGTVASPNGFKIYTKNGDCISEYILNSEASNEPEGVFIDRQTHELYISFVGRQLYKVKIP